MLAADIAENQGGIAIDESALERLQGFKDYPEEFAVPPELITRETTAPVNPRSRRR